MIELELDGKKVQAIAGSSILDVAIKEGKYIPHFCYHKKLSIAANCRMCLVEVEKSNKPLPACATPVTEGMKVHTCSEIAVNAQKGVMEFLLINHPLDCPICDQGGECQLQDLAVGYGKSKSRYSESKRSVTNKDIGPLIATEMTRCIHCSRCVRFTDEIAGYQELGMSYRNNHVEVMPFIGKTVNSEISGNIIDICPVGALTSKPFRNQARSWELSRRKTISPHDSLGSNLIAQIDKYNKVVRILPYENENVNECWISDRDRFSYEALYHEDRITSPMIKQNNEWIKVDWNVALQYAAKSIKGTINDHGEDNIAVIASAISTTEELFLLQKLVRKLGINNLDYRMNQSDFRLDNYDNGCNYLGISLNQLFAKKSLLVLGSKIRSEQPLIAARIRKAVKNGMQLNSISYLNEDLLCDVTNQLVIDPRYMTYYLSLIIKVIDGQILEDEYSKNIVSIVESIKDDGYILIGEIAKMQFDYADVISLVQQISDKLGISYGFLLGKANEIGANLVGFVPYKGPFNNDINIKGQNAHQMLVNQKKCYILFNTELECDTLDSHLALNTLSNSSTNIVFSAFINENMLSYADVILPITPFTETAGSYINLEGIWQKFNGVTKPLGDSRPAWKVIRALANILGFEDFLENSIEDVRLQISSLNNLVNLLGNNTNYKVPLINDKKILNDIIRIGIQSIYDVDSLSRRSYSLQQTSLANPKELEISYQLANKLSLKENDVVKIKQSSFTRKFKVSISENMPNTLVLLPFNRSNCGMGNRLAKVDFVNN
jgi:NADH-quinone oxidoreductase subunit G